MPVSDRYSKRKKDFYYRTAKRQGYRSRASFKLKEIQKKYRIFRKGDLAVDLGAAPGGWLQVISEEVGPKGLVVGVDLKPILDFENRPNIITIVGNAESPLVQEKIISLLKEKPDVVVSDMAPNVTGHWDLDHARQISLARTAHSIARNLLKQQGRFLVKVFMGQETEDFLAELKDDFAEVLRFRPKATRKTSAEEYFVCRGYTGGD